MCTEVNCFVESFKIYHICTMKVNMQTVITIAAVSDSSLKKYVAYKLGMWIVNKHRPYILYKGKWSFGIDWVGR